jgi:hypothetical protein
MMLGSNRSYQPEKRRPQSAIAIVLGLCILAVQSCAPQRPYRRPVPSAAAKPQPEPAPIPSPPTSAPGSELSSRSIPPDPKIREQDLKANEKVQPSITTSKEAPPPIAPPETLTPAKPPLVDDSSLLAKIIPGTQPQRAASLRLSEESYWTAASTVRHSAGWSAPSRLIPPMPMVIFCWPKLSSVSSTTKTHLTFLMLRSLVSVASRFGYRKSTR